MTIRATSTLTEVAFAVCTALDLAGAEVVLTGGSAATVYAPDAYQSRDLDFIVLAGGDDARATEALENLGFALSGIQYKHDASPYTLDFPKGPLAVGQELITGFDTLTEGGSILHILTPTDSCKDRLAAFIHWDDRSSLEQALAVAQRHRARIDLGGLDRWASIEGGAAQVEEFRRSLDPPA